MAFLLFAILSMCIGILIVCLTTTRKRGNHVLCYKFTNAIAEEDDEIMSNFVWLQWYLQNSYDVHDALINKGGSLNLLQTKRRLFVE